jgi:hypothetical protein
MLCDVFRLEVVEAEHGRLVAPHATGLLLDVGPSEIIVGDSADAHVRLDDPYGRPVYLRVSSTRTHVVIRCESAGRGAWIVRDDGLGLSRVDRLRFLHGLRHEHLEWSVANPAGTRRYIRALEKMVCGPSDCFARLTSASSPFEMDDGTILLPGLQLRIRRSPVLLPMPSPQLGSAPTAEPLRTLALEAARVEEEAKHDTLLAKPTSLATLVATIGGCLLERTKRSLLKKLGELPDDGWHPPPRLAQGPLSLVELVDAILRERRPAELAVALAVVGSERPYSFFSYPGDGGDTVLAYPLDSNRGEAFAKQVWERFCEIRATSIEPMPPALRVSRDTIPPSSFTIECEGDVWLLQLGDESVRLKSSRGLAILSELVSHPGEELDSLELHAPDAVASHAGEVRDAKSITELEARRARLLDQEQALTSCGDRLRAVETRREVDRIDAELKRAQGLGGRIRRDGDLRERARQNVQKRLHDVIERLRSVAPRMATHLERTITTGLTCSYRPGKRR